MIFFTLPTPFRPSTDADYNPSCTCMKTPPLSARAWRGYERAPKVQMDWIYLKKHQYISTNRYTLMSRAGSIKMLRHEK
ncbi:hypothetical protein ACUHMQ_13400 [Chitinimonas sp. PSY-7]|uniref:hypothetical protein n=1 Tax=Chitinimonas sp. PSY-7 TaxID=3459088 RepID=UPI0040401C41